VICCVQTHHRGHHGMRMTMCLLRGPAGTHRLLFVVTLTRQIPGGGPCLGTQLEDLHLCSEFAIIMLLLLIMLLVSFSIQTRCWSFSCTVGLIH